VSGYAPAVLAAAGARRRTPASRTAGLTLPLAALGAVLGVVALSMKARHGYHSAVDTALGGAGGFLFLAAGAAAHARQPANRVGLLMVLSGTGFFAEDLQLSGSPWPHSVGLLLTGASSGFLAHLLLAFPDGRLRGRFERALVAAAYAGVFVLIPMRALVDDTRGRPLPRPNLLLVTSNPRLSLALGHAVEGVAAAVAAGVAAVLVRRWLDAGLPMRRVLAPVALAGLVGAVATTAAGVVGAPSPWRPVGRWVYSIAFCLLPLGFLARLLHVRLGRTAVGTLLGQLRQPLPAAQLQAALARALGDPSLQVGYWRPESQDYVDGDGRPVPLPAPGSARVVTLVERDGGRVAALVHDPGLHEDPGVLDAVAAAAGLALDNRRLAAQVLAQLAEVEASRGRIVAAADAERRRLERDLHDGPQQRLLVAMLALRRAQQRLDAAGDAEAARLVAAGADELDAAIGELRELARGIYPAILADAGLLPALRALGQRAPLPVEVVTEIGAAGDPPWPGPAEAAAYFVAVEALSNTLKHAGATEVRIAVRAEAGRLRVAVTDDGVGGADLAAGSGLLGLRDRVSALGGTLTVESVRGRGTVVSAAIPYAGPAAAGR
jgi:signal transduction histidine kinase